MPDKNLKLILSAESDKTKTMPELRQNLRLVNEEMNRLISEGKRGSQEYALLKQRSGELTTQIKHLQREFKGLGPAARNSTKQILEMFENISIIMVTLQAKLRTVTDFMGDSIKKGLDRQVISDYFKGTIEDLNNLKTASAGTINETVLKSLSIQASDLNISMREQIILMSLAEKVADKNLTTTEEGFKDVIAISEGRTKVVKDLNIETGKYKQRVEELAGAYKVEFDQLDPAIQKQIRLQALIELSGETFDTATNKVQDNKDKFESLSASWDNFKGKLGEGIIETLTGRLDDMGIALDNLGIHQEDAASFTEKLTDKFTGHLDILVRMVLPWTNLIDVVKDGAEKFAQVRDAVNDSDTALGQVRNTLASAVPTVFIDTIWQAVEDAKQNLRDFLFLIGMLEANTAGNSNIGGVTGDATGDRGRKFKSSEQKKKDKSGNSSAPDKEDKDNLTFEEEINKKILDLREKIANEPLKKIKAGYQEEIDLLQLQLDFAKGLYDNLIDFSKLQSQLLPDDNVQQRTGGDLGEPTGPDITFKELAQLNILIPVIDSATASIQQLFSAFSQGDPEPFKQFMRTVVNSFITGIQAIILGGDAAMLAQAILNPFTLLKNAPLKAAAIIALEAAKGLLAGLNEGGNVGPGSYLVGDAKGGRVTPYSEILHVPPGSKASVYPNRQLSSLMSGAVNYTGGSANVTNYIRVDMDKGRAYLDGKASAGKYSKSMLIKN